MKELVAIELAKSFNLESNKLASLIEVPSNSSLGDFAFPCFSLAKELKKNPNEIANEFAKKINSLLFEKVVAVGPYINFFVSKTYLANLVLSQVLSEKESYGSGKINRKVILEFPSPNTNKPLHIGHARNIILGQAIYSILSFNGNNVVIVNLNNDRGVHICKSMLAYNLSGKKETPSQINKKGDHFVGDYYVEFAKLAEKNPELEKEAQKYLQLWESEDQQIRTLWKEMNSWALKGFHETYSKFNLTFKKEYFESEIYKFGKEIITEGLTKGVFQKKQDGAVFVDLTKEGLGEKILLRADGTSIYITQDIYLALLKQEEFKADASIIVSANEQLHHFKVLFKVLSKLGNSWAENSSHLNYGMVNLPSGRMKSREGTVVDADDLIFELTDLASKEIKSRYPNLTDNEVKTRSQIIALAALRYYFLKVDRGKDILFNPEDSIAFEGDTGPYLLYTYARAKSILSKADYSSKLSKIPSSIDDTEKALLIHLAKFNEVALHAYEQLAPNLIANYAFELAQLFNGFYHKNQVVGSSEEDFRLNLVDASSQVLKNALSLLSIPVLENM